MNMSAQRRYSDRTVELSARLVGLEERLSIMTRFKVRYFLCLAAPHSNIKCLRNQIDQVKSDPAYDPGCESL